MSLVECSYRQEEETSLEACSSVHCDVDVGLLELDLTGLALSRKGVLKLKFRIQGDLVTESVVNKENPTVEINLVVVVLV